MNSDQVAGIFITVAVSYPLGLPLLISTSKIGLSKTYPSHFGVVLLIFGWIGPWHIPACHTAHFHGLSLDGADAQIFVQLICQLHIPFLVASVPLGGVVAGFTPFNADELAGGPQSGETQLCRPSAILGANRSCSV